MSALLCASVVFVEPDGLIKEDAGVSVTSVPVMTPLSNCNETAALRFTI